MRPPHAPRRLATSAAPAPATPAPAALAALAALALTACAHAPPAARPLADAAGVARVALDLGSRGRMVAVVPPGWTATPGDAQPPLPATLRLDPPDVHALLLLTPLWDPAVPPGAPAGERGARTMAELAREKALETAAERDVPLVALGGGATGWWFAVTDGELAAGGRAAGPEEYRALVQGAASVGGLVVAFTLLDDGDGPHRAAVLELVRQVRHEPLGPAAPAPLPAAAPGPPGAPAADGPSGQATPAAPGGGAPGTPPREGAPTGAGGPADPAGWRTQGRAPVAVTFPGKAWSVSLALPGFQVDGPDVLSDGALVHLVAQEAASGLVASVVLRAAGGRASAAACADADWKRIAVSLGQAPPVERRTDAPPSPRRPEGARVRADYFVTQQRGERVDQQNLSAWWYRDGVCVHVHVSLMGYQPADAPALERVLAAVAFTEAL